MARSGLSAVDITTAYDALVDAGVQPSIRAIRAHLGNTGSLKTIADHVRVLKSERWQAPGPALPDPLMQSLIKGAESYWSELAEAADSHIEANNVQCAEQLDAMRAERDEAQHNEASMREALSACKAHLSTLESQLGESSDRLQSTLQILETTKEQTDQAQTQVRELDSAMHELTTERDVARRRLSESQQSISSLENQLTAAERDHAAVQLARDQAEDATTAELLDAQAALSAATQTLTHWDTRHEQWEQERQSLRVQVSSLKDASASDQNQLSEQQQLIGTLQSENAAKTAQLDVTRSMAADADSRQQSILKALSAEFAAVVREAHSEAGKNSIPTSSS